MALQDFISSPPTRGTIDEVDAEGNPVRVSQPWSAFFDRVFKVCFAQSQSGTTAQRPTVGLYPGRRYFDTSLGANGKPIWVDKSGAAWVLADGTSA